MTSTSERRRSARGSVRPAAGLLLPQALCDRYYAEGHWRREDLWTSFDAIATLHASRVAFVEGGRQVTFGELRAFAVRFGTELQLRGLEPGETVVVHGRHCLEAVVAILGCAWGGFVVAPLPHIFSPEQIRTVASATGSRAIVALGEPAEVDRALAAASLAGVSLVVTGPGAEAPEGSLGWPALMATTDAGGPRRRPMGADSPALIIFSSGTTGQPKGVLHSSNTVRFTVETYARCQGIEARDVSLVVTAFGFVGSTILGIYMSFFTGCRTVLLRSWSAEEALALIVRHRATHILLMPTHAIDILDSPALASTDHTSLRRGVVAGLTAERREQARERLCAMPFPMYGMSESPGHVTGSTGDAWHDLRTTEGRPLPGTDLLICDDDDRPVPAGELGNILVRGPNRFLGYWGADELNRESLSAQGFFRTGDVGFLNESGYLIFVSRSKDIIRRGGVTITPSEVEAVLRPHPRIADVVVIGLPDARLGERACACVITRDGRDVTLEDLCDFLEKRGLARYLWPESVVRCDSFPRTPSLKVQKHELRERVLAQADTPVVTR